MKKQFFIGIDIGGTKISAGLSDDSGKILEREKYSTPQNAGHKEIISTVYKLVKDILARRKLKPKNLEGIGIGIPGIVDTAKEKILITPNINLTGIDVVGKIEKKLKTKVVIGNDVNLGTLGEKWRGAAGKAENVVGIFPGTGIGGGVIVNGKLLTGSSSAAAEIGHIIIDVNGPKCSCGNRGCLEALASRWAIERDIRQAVKEGKKSVITELTGGDLGLIKSKTLREALKRKDPLVTGIMNRASRILGLACVTLRHIFDPEIIVFGGGLIEACGNFILPVVRKTVESDPFFSDIAGCKITESWLGDDAVILGAIVLVQEHLGRDPFIKGFYPRIRLTKLGEVVIDNNTYIKDVFVRADAKIRKRNKKLVKKLFGTSQKISPEELSKICKKRPDVLIIGYGHDSPLQLAKQSKGFLKRKKIKYKLLPVPEAIHLYNKTKQRKAILLQVTV